MSFAASNMTPTEEAAWLAANSPSAALMQAAAASAVVTHGTGGYARGCRCDVCRAGKLAYNRARRDGTYVRTIAHGATRYRKYACRCAVCLDGHAEERRRERERRAIERGASPTPSPKRTPTRKPSPTAKPTPVPISLPKRREPTYKPMVHLEGVHYHRWKIETPDGPYSEGRCECGASKQFPNSQDAAMEMGGKKRPDFTNLPVATGGSTKGRAVFAGAEGRMRR